MASQPGTQVMRGIGRGVLLVLWSEVSYLWFSLRSANIFSPTKSLHLIGELPFPKLPHTLGVG
jgi:hypothetical protein